MKSKEIILKKVTVDQILNMLKITGRNRDIISLKYENEILTEKDWMKKLKSFL